MLLNEDKFIKKYILNDDGHDAENDDGGWLCWYKLSTNECSDKRQPNRWWIEEQLKLSWLKKQRYHLLL